jgi:hypothetical protein
MYARMLFAWPVEAKYRPLTVQRIEPVIISVFDRLVRLADDNYEIFEPRDVALSTDAVDMFEDFRRHVHEVKDTLDGREREWWAKADAHVLRLTGTLAYLSWAVSDKREPNEIGAKFIKSAVRLVRDYFWPHSRAALRQIGLSDRHVNARRVLRWIQAQKKESVSRDDIRRDALSRSLDADDTQSLLEGLVRAGWLRQEIHPTATRPKIRWNVNPKLFEGSNKMQK